MRRRIALSILVLTAAVAVAVPSPSAEAASCTKRTGVSHTSPWGQTYKVDWVCGNRSGAPVRLNSEPLASTGWLDTRRSWFVCYTVGAQHGGGNEIWYLTQGDRVANGMGFYRGWGYVAAEHVWTSIDPAPGMRRC